MNIEIIKFTFAGLKLQEPMALLTNWLISLFCLYAYFNIYKDKSEEVEHWKRFFIVFSISTFFGGLGHLFFQYWGIPGKFPNWITGVLSGYFAGKAIIVRMTNELSKKNLERILIVKCALFISLAIFFQKFIFVAVDAIVTYITFCGIIAYMLYKNGKEEMKYMVYGVLVSLPAVFIFLLKINPHIWFNKDDLSHILMLFCVMFFYLGVKKLAHRFSTPSID